MVVRNQSKEHSMKSRSRETREDRNMRFIKDSVN